MEDIFISSESEEAKRISHLLRVDEPGTFINEGLLKGN